MAHCSFEGSSGSAAAVAAVEAEFLEEDQEFSQNSAKTPNSVGLQEEAISAEVVVSARTVRKRRIAGIFQHYYPEGGWGWVILLCGFLVQVLAVGLQQSLAILVFPLSGRRYQVADNGYIGKKYTRGHLYSSFILVLLTHWGKNIFGSKIVFLDLNTAVYLQLQF